MEAKPSRAKLVKVPVTLGRTSLPLTRRDLFQVPSSLVFPSRLSREVRIPLNVTKAHLLKGEVNYCYMINLTRKLLRLMKQCLLSDYRLPMSHHRNIYLPKENTYTLTDNGFCVNYCKIESVGQHM